MKSKNTLIIAIVGVVVVVGLVVGIILLTNSNKGSKDDEIVDKKVQELAKENLKGDEEDDEEMTRAVIKDNGNSSLVDYTKLSPNYDPRNHEIDTITIHMMKGQLAIETVGNIYYKDATKASANYGVGPDGKIGLYVEEKNRSWSSSNAANDHRAITIDVASDSVSPYKVNDKAYDALIELVTDICKRNGIKKLVWSENSEDRVNHTDGANMTVHKDFAKKECPGEYLYSRMGEIADKVNEKLNEE